MPGVSLIIPSNAAMEQLSERSDYCVFSQRLFDKMKLKLQCKIISISQYLFVRTAGLIRLQGPRTLRPIRLLLFAGYSQMLATSRCHHNTLSNAPLDYASHGFPHGVNA